LRPNLPDAHQLLSKIYFEQGYRDLALEHFKEEYKIHRLAGPRGTESPEDFAKRMKQMEQAVNAFDKEVKGRFDQFAISSSNRKLIDQVEKAREYGLPGKALQLLLDAAPSEIKLQEAQMELELLLTTGRLFLFQKAFTPEIREQLGEAGDT